MIDVKHVYDMGVDMPAELPGRRVRLRPSASTDADALLAVLTHPGVAEVWRDYDRGSVQDDLIGPATFVIELDGEVVGLIQFYEEEDPEYRHAGMDIAMHPDVHGQGLGQDAVRTLARYLIEVRGHHRLVIDPAAHNERAIRTYAAVGFKPVGIMRRYEQTGDGGWHDGLLMDLLADELTAG